MSKGHIAVSREFLSDVPMFGANYLERYPVDFDHWDCPEDICIINHIDKKTHVTQH